GESRLGTRVGQASEGREAIGKRPIPESFPRSAQGYVRRSQQCVIFSGHDADVPCHPDVGDALLVCHPPVLAAAESRGGCDPGCCGSYSSEGASWLELLRL